MVSRNGAQRLATRSSSERERDPQGDTVRRSRARKGARAHRERWLFGGERERLQESPRCCGTPAQEKAPALGCAPGSEEDPERRKQPGPVGKGDGRKGRQTQASELEAET